MIRTVCKYKYQVN